MAIDSLAVDRLVLEAAVLDTAERRELWRRQTVDDPELLAAVEQRLSMAAALPSTFLALPVAELLEDLTAVEGSDVDLTAGSDRYELQEVLGQGGMATVRSAFDHQLQRPVALKIFDDTRTDDRERLLQEARAQARVRHDHVLEIYDTGILELDGIDQPYLAMRLVDAGTLMDLPAETSVEERVRLVTQAADGLHAAHREGLIHRDVKPSNLLVESIDGVATVRVSDFGIALAEDRDDAVLAGTPAYLAPEALADPTRVDRRIDVWGLGATLYQVLSGRLPFDGETVSEILDQVRERPPSPLPKSLPNDLIAIVERCLKKDPDQRYPSARSLADDLRRFLNGEPVEAVTSTWAYRWSKRLERHRRWVQAATVALVLLIGALGLAAWQGVQAQRANTRAQARQGQAESLVTFMLGDLRDKLAALGRLDVLEAVGEQAMAYFAAVPEAELQDDELSRRAQALYQIGEVSMGLGNPESAAQSFARSLDLARGLAHRHPEDLDHQFALGQSEYYVGLSHFEHGDLVAAERHFKTYLEISEQLVDRRPDPRHRLELAYAESNLGSLEQRRGDLDRAKHWFRRSLERAHGLAEEQPDDLDLIFELAVSHNLLAMASMADGSLEEAREQLSSEHRLRLLLVERQPKHIPNRHYLATSHNHLGRLQLMLGRLDEAMRHAKASELIYDRLAEHDPENSYWSWSLAVSRVSQARNLRLSGRLHEAGTKLQDILAALPEKPANRDDQSLSWVVLSEQGQLLLAMGRVPEASSKLARAEEQARKLFDSSPEETEAIQRLARSLLLSAEAHSALGEPTEAASRLDEAARILDRSADRSWEHSALRASMLLERGLIAEAQRVVADLRAKGFAHPEYATLWQQPQ